jgi:hypothetical protein
MGIYTACFDASGHEKGQDFLVVSGFLSTADHWIRFETEWKSKLSKYGIACLHMREFDSDAKTLTKAERHDLLSDLCDVIGQYTFRHFSAVIENRIMLSSLSEAVRKEYFLNSYVLAGRTAVATLGIWMQSQNMVSPLQLVFEKGDVGEGNLRKRLEDDGYIDVQFRYKKDKVIKNKLHPGFVPLQACDFLAHEVYTTVRDAGKKETSWLFERFTQMPCEMRICSIEDHKEMERWLRTSEGVTEWILKSNIPLPKGTLIKSVTIKGKSRKVRTVKKVK